MPTTLLRSTLVLLFFAFVAPLSLFVASVSNPEHVEVFPAPRSATFLEGSTFELPIFVHTHGHSINTIELNISFDRSKLRIINPSGGTSIIGIWIEPPFQDNTKGVVRIVGVVPSGVTTDSGLIATLTFQALEPGNASVSFSKDSVILLNDGLGTSVPTDFVRGVYTILPKPADGLVIFSETHPAQSNWYNNKNPVFSWEAPPGVTGYSFILDSAPNTVPENISLTTATVKGYENVVDGVSYFHLKAFKNGVWGSPSHFPVRIDSVPPELFSPRIQKISDPAGARRVVLFETTDRLSGLSHYEIGIVNRNRVGSETPVFVQVTSPYQLPADENEALQVTVRAVDKAGNVRDANVSTGQWASFATIAGQYAPWFLLAVILLFMIGWLAHYLYGHHILESLARAWAVLRRETAKEELKEIQKELNQLPEDTRRRD
ncbi:cohesin domain-containing protein [Patescibacteria group bacterium]|nr:cohesin domain-containing protein [Patescibacteria group bacterium]